MKNIILVILAVYFSSCAKKSNILESVSSTSISANKSTAKKYLEEVVNHQRLDLLKDIFTNDSIVVKGKSVSQIKNKEDFLPYLFKAFPDIHYTIDEIIAEGDKVFIHSTAKGTHKTEFLGLPALGNKFEVKELFIFKMENGKVKSSFGLLDRYALERQLK